MSLTRACVLSVLLVPALAVMAAEKAYPGTTKSNPPPVATSGSYLIDKTIPAYGVLSQVPHYTDSRANALYLEIHQVLADVESHVMAGSAAAPAADAKNKKKEEPVASIGDARITELLNRLVELDARIAYRTYLEQWHLDTSFSDLGRAANLLAMNGQVGVSTVDKVQGTKAKTPPEAAPVVVAPAPKPAAPVVAPAVAAPEAPAPAAAPEAPAAAPAAAAPIELPAAEPPADK